MADVRIAGVSKRFGPVTALSDVSIDVATGEVIALLGPSGCGKTTLLRCLAGLEQPTSGLIEVGGQTLWSPSVFVPPTRRDIAMVFQSYALWPHMSVRENVSYGLRVQKTKRAVVKEQVTEVLQLLGLEHLGDRYPGQLSGGQQQRVAVARALALRAAVVLFDEPLSNLDLRLREGVRADLRRVLKALRQTAVYVTHDIGEAVVVADRIVMMSAGQVVQVGTPEQVYFQPRNRYVAEFVGNTNVFEAKVVRAEGAARLVVGDMLSFAAGSLPAGVGSVQVMIRPEYVQVGPPGDPAGIQARVAEVEFIGQVTALSIELGAQKLRAITLSRPDLRFTPGAACSVRIADDAIVILSEGG